MNLKIRKFIDYVLDKTPASPRRARLRTLKAEVAKLGREKEKARRRLEVMDGMMRAKIQQIQALLANDKKNGSR